MEDMPQVNTAVDAVRCLYLAQVAEQAGKLEAAQRWRELADNWVSHVYSEPSGRSHTWSENLQSRRPKAQR